MSHHRLVPALVLIACIAGGCAAPPAPIGVGVVERVEASFFDADAAARWAARHADLDREPPEAIRAALAELHASHTDFVTEDDARYADLQAIFGAGRDRVERATIGIDLADPAGQEGRMVVRRVRPGSPAQAAGVLRGDEIVDADGRPFHPVRSLRDRREVTLHLRRSPGEPLLTRTVAVGRERVRAAWLEDLRHGIELRRLDGGTVGILPLWCGAGEEFLDAIQEAILGPLADADALVLDLRDGYGGCSPEYARPFLGAGVPAIESRDRSGRLQRYDPQWRRPMVVVVNRGTRSGKEVLARALQRAGRATIVGEPSAGAVLGGRVFPLPSGALLYLAVQDATVDGERLEGVGVAPDVRAADPLLYAAGRDPLLEQAIERALGMVRAEGRPDPARGDASTPPLPSAAVP